MLWPRLCLPSFFAPAAHVATSSEPDPGEGFQDGQDFCHCSSVSLTCRHVEQFTCVTSTERSINAMNSKQAGCLIDALNICGIKHLIVVPASGLELVCRHFEAQGHCLYATREEEAIAIATGLSLGGEKTTVVMAQAGLGNALNAVFTLADAYSIYFPILVCFRGEQDPNWVQRVSAKQTHRVLETLDCAEISWDDPLGKEEFKKLVDHHQRWFKCSLQ